MIKANELRIGNILEYNDNGERFEVLEISELGISVKSEREIIWMEFDNFSPISLTEEILLKCGFVKDKDEYTNFGLVYSDIYELDLGRKCFRIQISQSSIIYRADVGMDWCEIGDYVEHLHQLQNIYWCLVGEELNIKL